MTFPISYEGYSDISLCYKVWIVYVVSDASYAEGIKIPLAEAAMTMCQSAIFPGMKASLDSSRTILGMSYSFVSNDNTISQNSYC